MRQAFKLSVVWLMFTALAGQGQCQDFSKQKGNPQPDQETNAFLERIRSENNLVGLACCVIRQGKVVALGAAGVRKQGSPQRLTVQDKLHLGSCTKAMTATVAAQFVADGKITWDTKLQDVFTNLRGKIHADYQNVTLLDLLTHQSGVPKNNINGWPQGNRLRTIRFKLIEQSLRPEPENRVGEFFYSNLGYITAGAMLEKVSHKKWEELIEERLFEPLKMKSAGFGPPSLSFFSPERRSGKRQDNDKVEQPWGHRQDKEGVWVPSQRDNRRFWDRRERFIVRSSIGRNSSRCMSHGLEENQRCWKANRLNSCSGLGQPRAMLAAGFP